MKRQIIVSAIVTLLLFSILSFLTLPAKATDSNWSMPRPTTYRRFNDNITSAVISSDAQTALTLSVANITYVPAPGGTDDNLVFQVDVAASTREGISYGWTSPPYGYSWVTVDQTVPGFSGDNSRVWFQLDFPVLFYGVNYTGLWIYSNGFVSFTSGNYAAASPTSLPNGNMKDTIVAPFWKMLKLSQGGSIKTGKIIQSWPGDNGLRDYQVFTWDSIPDVNGNFQTFQMLLQDRAGLSLFSENLIYFQYLSITTNVPTTVGGQDRLGYHGCVYPLSGISNHIALGMTAQNGAGGAGYRLTTLKYTITKSDTNAMLLPNPLYEEGWNVKLNSSGNKWTNFWQQVIEAGATHLAGLTGIGEMIDGLYLMYDLTGAAAEAYYIPASGDLVSATRTDNQALGFVDCESHDTSASDGAMYNCPFDAAFTNSVFWYMVDQETLNHTITVTATASYEDWNQQVYFVSTSVVLSMYVGQHYLDLQTTRIYSNGSGVHDSTDVPVWVNGTEYYNTPITILEASANNYTLSCGSTIWRDSIEYVFDHWSPTPPGASVNPQTFNLTSDLNMTAVYYPLWNLTINVPTSETGWGTTNPTGIVFTEDHSPPTNQTVTASPASGYVLSSWWLDGNLYGTSNPVNVSMGSSHNLTAMFGLNGGGGDGCPQLLVWNGNSYVSYGVINVHNPTGEDVQKEVWVSKQDVGVSNYTANLLLIEGWIGLNFSESEIDQVQLYAVDAWGNSHLCPLINATQSRLGDVLLPLLFNDEWKVQSYLHETISLKFLVPYPSWLVQSYTFVIEGVNRYKN